jgi:hypothetical protein
MITFFNSDKYEQLYPEVKDYSPNISNKHYRLYDHYIKFGKTLGYAGNHKSLPIFYHIPKCGGTSIMYNLFLENIDRQYNTIIQSNGLYLINVAEKNETIIQLICYPYNSVIKQELFVSIDVSNNRYFNTNISYSTNNIDYLCKNFDILAVCIKSYGLKNSNTYIDLITQHTRKYPELYTVLRNPNDRSKSEFYYLKDFGIWESSASCIDKDTSLYEYLALDKITDNFIIRNLMGIPDTQAVSKEYLNLCKNILDSFTHIGILENLNLFTNFVCEKYNWIYRNDNQKLNENKISKVKLLSKKEQVLLNNKNFYDNELYKIYYKQIIK